MSFPLVSKKRKKTQNNYKKYSTPNGQRELCPVIGDDDDMIGSGGDDDLSN